MVQAKSSGRAWEREKPSRLTSMTSFTSMNTMVMTGVKATASAMGSVIHHCLKYTAAAPSVHAQKKKKKKALRNCLGSRR